MFKITFFDGLKTKYCVSWLGLFGLLSQVLMPQPVLALLGGAEQIEPLLAEADFAQPNELAISQETALLSFSIAESPQASISEGTLSTKYLSQQVKPQFDNGQRWAIVTAYSSTIDQCDATPHITAQGTLVRDGIVASNFLPFGTKIKFPQLYPDKVFVVEDRMAAHNSHKIDIWFPTRWEAKQFGVKYTPVVIME